VYLENISRILYHSGKRFNFYDLLCTAYDDKILARQIKIAIENANANPNVTRQQRLTLEMSVHNLLATFQDKDRVSKIQGLINHMMTYMSDSLATITGPYEIFSPWKTFSTRTSFVRQPEYNVNESAVIPSAESSFRTSNSHLGSGTQKLGTAITTTLSLS